MRAKDLASCFSGSGESVKHVVVDVLSILAKRGSTGSSTVVTIVSTVC